MTCPGNFPSKTTKILFLGLREIPHLLHLLKICFSCCMYLDLFLEYIVMSSKYTTTLWSIIPLKSMSMDH